ncbi:MAG: SAM-dependent methyltransferase [Actinobacteria bacterium]|nr:SAM-dependent methyltransferase [Actinomycetota bacterium]
MSSFTIQPIGFVRSSRDAAIDDDWDAVTALIELDAEQLQPDATQGLADFSHIEVVFLFDRVDAAAVCRGSRHPRGNTAWPQVGILAQRAKDRPNRVGLTTCRVQRVDGLRIEVSGLDAIEGTPVIDIKPVMAGFAARGEVSEPAWAAELMAGYW